MPRIKQRSADDSSKTVQKHNDGEDHRPKPPPTYLLNGRFLLVSVVLVVALAGGMFALHRAQRYRLRHSFRERAESELAEGNHASAVSLLRQYLQFTPDDLDARLQLDTLQWEHAESPDQIVRAMGSSEALLRDHPDLADVRRRQVEKLLFIGRFSDALDHAAHLRSNDEPDAALDVWEGIAHEGAGDNREAEQAYLRVVWSPDEVPSIPFGDSEWNRIDVIARLANLYVNKLNERDLALDLLDRNVTRFPESARLRTVRARLRSTIGGPVDATFADLDKAVALNETQESLPGIETILLYVAQLRQSPERQTERMNRVVGYCRKLAEEGLDDYRLYTAWAALESRRKRRNIVIDVLRRGRKAIPDEPLLSVFLADELISNQLIDDARVLVSEAEADGNSEIYVDYLNGRLAMEDEKWTAARDLLRGVQRRAGVPTNVQSRATLYLGACYSQLGDLHQELTCYLGLVDDEEVSLPAQLGAARCLANLGRWDEASQTYRRLPATAYSSIELARVELRRALAQPASWRSWESFDNALAQAIQENPNDPAATNLRSKAERARAADNDSDDIVGDHLLKGQMLMAAGRMDEAEAGFRRAVENSPEREDAWLALAEFLIKQQRESDAESVASEARRQLTSLESQGRLEEILGNVAAAEDKFQEAAQSKSVSSIISLAAFYIRADQAVKSIPLLEEVLNQSDISLSAQQTARRLLAAALVARSYADLPHALELLEQNIAQVSDPTDDRRQQAHLLARYPFPNHVSRIIELLTSIQMHQSLTADDTAVLAKAYDVQGNEHAADAAWAALFAMRDLPPNLLKACVERQLEHHQLGHAETGLARLEDAVGIDGDVLRLQGWLECLHSRSDEVIAMIDQYLDSSAAKPEESAVARQLLAAGVLRQLAEEFSGDPDVFAPLTKKAAHLYRQISDGRPSSVLPYALLLTTQNRGDEAINGLESVRGQIPEPQRLAAAISTLERSDVSEPAAQKVEQWVTRQFQSQPTSESAILYEHYLRVVGEFDRAADLNRQLLAAMPDNVTVLNNQSWLMTMLESPQQAIELVSRAIKVAGPQPFLLDTRGMARLLTNDTAGAIDDLNQALNQEESDIIRYHLALAYLRSGNEETAQVHFNRLTGDKLRLRRTLPRSEQVEFDQTTMVLATGPDQG